MLNEILFFVTGVCVFFGSLAFHELGHWLAFYKYGKKVKFYLKREGIGFIIETGKKLDYIFLKDDEYFTVCVMGIMIGFLPIFIAGIFLPIYWGLTLPYMWGAMQDVVNVVKLLQSGAVILEE